MKVIKILTLSAILLFNISAYSQESSKERSMFVRVFDLQGKKISKGHVVFTNDTILRLKKGKKFINESVKNIGQIKTKRSVGNSVLITSLIGGATGAVIGFGTSEEETNTGDGAWSFGTHEYASGASLDTGTVIGGGIGLASGALIGLGSSLFRKSETFIIDGDLDKWKIFKQLL